MRASRSIAEHRSPRVRQAVAALIVILCTLTACGPTAKKSATAAATPPVAVSTPTAVQGTAAWTPCPQIQREVVGASNPEFTFDCATIKVPQDWHNPNNGKTFDIALVRARSKTQHDRIGSLVVNPGGPGGSGIQLAAGLLAPGQKFPTDITDRFDIVGFDPRGVGMSTEVQCLTPPAQDAIFGADPDPMSQADFDKVVALNRAAEAPCGQKYGSQLPLFSTEQAARDIDAVRMAVGDALLNYLGYSYGTLLGAVYAELFPTTIRAMVLDGAIDPKQDIVARSEAQAAGFEHAFDDFSTWCTANPADCPIADDPRGAVVAALAQGRTAPATGPDGRKATAGWIFTGVAEAMYAKAEWPILAAGISDLRTGDATNIFRLADNYAERSPNGQYTNLFDANDAVNCADFSHQPTLAQIRQYQQSWRQKYPLFGAALATGMISCAVHVWPGTYDPYPTGPATGAPPILVIGTTGDPATPYAQTQRLATMLGNAVVVTWEGEGHTAYPQTKCITDVVDAYLINLTVPPAGTTCPATG